jgi:hypothetical protein
MTFTTGDHVIWMHVPRGGYFSRDRYYPVEATITLLSGQHTATIRVQLRNGRYVERRVRIVNLRPQSAQAGHA